MKASSDRSKTESARALAGKARAVLSALVDNPRYFVKAYVVVALLVVASMAAPMLPPWALPLIFIAYALIATTGLMYDVVVNRIYRQVKLNPTGKLARFNRRWTAWLFCLLAASAVSGMLFVLDSPRWDGLEWFLVVISPLVFFAVFSLTEKRLKRELAPRFHKAVALKISLPAAALVLSLLYALFSQIFSSAGFMLGQFADTATTFQAWVDAYPRPYADSPSALMVELGELSMLNDALTSYGLSQAAAQSLWVAFLVKFVVCLLIMLGLTSQFGACLLTKDEVESEFRLLPQYSLKAIEDPSLNDAALIADGEAADAKADGAFGEATGGVHSEATAGASGEAATKMPLLKRYFVIIPTVWLLATGVFLYADHQTALAREASQQTGLSAFVEDTKQALVIFIDNDIQVVEDAVEQQKKLEELDKEYQGRIDQLVEKRRNELDPLVDAYYASCANHLDTWTDWRMGAWGNATSFLQNSPFAGLVENNAKDAFVKDVVEPAQNEEAALQSAFAAWATELGQIQDEYWAKRDMIFDRPPVPRPGTDGEADSDDSGADGGNGSGSNASGGNDTEAGSGSGASDAPASTLGLWKLLEGTESDQVIREYLLYNGGDGDDETRRAAIDAKARELIDRAKSETFAQLDRLQNRITWTRD